MGVPGSRVRRTIAEKRRIVELTLFPGHSVARVAQAEGVNSHQVFQWRRAYRNGELELRDGSAATLLPVLLSQECTSLVTPDEHQGQEAEVEPVIEERAVAPSVAIHTELPGRALISVDSGADPILVRTIIESLRK